MFEPNYWYWSGILSEELCDSIILEGDKLISSDGRIGNGNLGGSYNPEIRETNITFFPNNHWIEGIALQYALLANTNSKWNINFSNPQNAQYCRYFPDQHYTPHRDDSINVNRNTMRKLSLVIQLSNPNDYEGGEFAIEQIDGSLAEVDLIAPRGSVIVFPSLLMHGVKPVTKGVRHSVVVWFEGPNWQ
jgi:PKHD-type hydroxylase